MAVNTAAEFVAALAEEQAAFGRAIGRSPQRRRGSRRRQGRRAESVQHGLITPWQAGQLLTGGSFFYFGKYRLLELLGRGGMGNVFLAEHVTMKRRVALKIISRRSNKDPEIARSAHGRSPRRRLARPSQHRPGI